MNAPFLAAYGLTHRYGKNLVLNEVSFEIEAGEMLAVLGPNGSGKSTLLKMISGILPVGKTGGIVRSKGADLLSMDPARRARQIAYVSGELRADFPLTAREAVMLGRICHGGESLLQRGPQQEDEVVSWAMTEALCWSLRDRDLASLSGGEKQLVALARALAQGSKILLLDEALSKMDLHHVALTGKMLGRRAAEGWSVILVSHDLNIASALCRTTLLLKQGRAIALGPTRDMLSAENIAKLYPGAEFRFVQGPGSDVPTVSI